MPFQVPLHTSIVWFSSLWPFKTSKTSKIEITNYNENQAWLMETNQVKVNPWTVINPHELVCYLFVCMNSAHTKHLCLVALHCLYFLWLSFAFATSWHSLGPTLVLTAPRLGSLRTSSKRKHVWQSFCFWFHWNIHHFVESGCQHWPLEVGQVDVK